MRIIGWTDGQKREIETNNPVELHSFAEEMDRVVYIQDKGTNND